MKRLFWSVCGVAVLLVLSVLRVGHRPWPSAPRLSHFLQEPASN